MTLDKLVNFAVHKTNFTSLESYIDFCKRYIEFTVAGLQAVIVSQNETNYRFYQYRSEGYFNITRPINAELFYSEHNLNELDDFLKIIARASEVAQDDKISRGVLIKSIYSIQQSIGATLDALPAGASNKARKINGDLFERLVQFLIQRMGISCSSGTIQVPVYVNKEFQFNMSYQHDLLLYNGEELKAIGSVKTSSKDRIDKIFLDKFLYSKLTETTLPHIAIFLNDVQRKNTSRVDQYGINSTFLSGHFKAFTIKLNPLDGVYYCDIRPNMGRDAVLKQHIKTIDHLFTTDIWKFVENTGMPLSRIEVNEEGQP